MVLWGARTQSYPNLGLKITKSTASRMKKTQDNHITITCASFVRLLSICIQRLEETPKSFNLLINRLDGLSADQFQGVHLNDIPIVEDLLTFNILLYDIDIVDRDIIGELARRSEHKYEITV